MFTRKNIKLLFKDIEIMLKSLNVNVKEMYLFGSYAKGTANENSDIDIAVFSEDFTGIRFKDFDLIKKIFLKHTNVEIHTFKPDDIHSEDNLFLNSIKNDFKKII
jgi:predicted nucleotidyltransferase